MLKSRAKELAKEEAQSKLDAEYVGMFKCRKCGKNKVTYTQAQTRSADEPMVRFKCLVMCFATLFLTRRLDNLLLLHELRKQVEGVKFGVSQALDVLGGQRILV